MSLTNVEKAIAAKRELTREVLTRDINSLLYSYYHFAGESWRFPGQSISFLRDSLRDKWRGLGGTYKFEALCEECGFVVIECRNDRNQKARAVTNEKEIEFARANANCKERW